jgi:hypothetical protein
MSLLNNGLQTLKWVEKKAKKSEKKQFQKKSVEVFEKFTTYYGFLIRR